MKEHPGSLEFCEHHVLVMHLHPDVPEALSQTIHILVREFDARLHLVYSMAHGESEGVSA